MTQMRTVFATDVKPKRWQKFPVFCPPDQTEKDKKLSFLNRYNFKPQRELVRLEKPLCLPIPKPPAKRPIPKPSANGLYLKSNRITLLDGRK